MPRFFILLALVGFLASAKAQDVVRFANGDLLRGALEQLSPTNGLQWKRADVLDPLKFRVEELAEVEFGPRPEAPAVSGDLTVLRLNNLDEIQGKLISVDQTNVVLAPWFANAGGPVTADNRLTIPRTNVLLVAPLGPGRRLVFEGPTGLEGWTKSKVTAVNGEAGEWRFKNNAFYATESASIARDLKLPDISSFQFDMEWRGFFYLAVALYTDYLHPVNLASKETEPDFGGFYSLQLNSFSANLLPVTKTDPLKYLGQAPVPGLAQKTNARVDIRVNKPKRTIGLLVDGQLVKEWVDSETFAGKGTAVRLVHQGQGAVKLHNIRVFEWDGYYEEKPTNSVALKSDLVKLRNGDRIFGSITKVAENTLSVASTAQNLDIPMARVKQLDFADRTLQTNVPPRSVRAHLATGGRLTFELDSWSPSAARIRHPLFGVAELKPEAFTKLEFFPLTGKAQP